MPKLKDRIAFRAVREALDLMRSVTVLEGKVKASVELLLKLALERLRGEQGPRLRQTNSRQSEARFTDEGLAAGQRLLNRLRQVAANPSKLGFQVKVQAQESHAQEQPFTQTKDKS